MGLESGITDFKGRKTNLFIPIWVADRCKDDLKYVNEKLRY
jgi:hypothetical protein